MQKFNAAQREIVITFAMLHLRFKQAIKHVLRQMPQRQIVRGRNIEDEKIIKKKKMFLGVAGK